MTSLVLASASPARRATLVAAGVVPVVHVSQVDEDAVLTLWQERFGVLEPADVVLLLAHEKADDVAGMIARGEIVVADDSVVLGCDSMLEFEGEVFGKPGSVECALERWRRMRGKSGVLHSGHWLIDVRNVGSSGGTVGASSSTVVHFADISDAEIDAYCASGEPMAVAGGFTIDGSGGAFISGIEGDHHGVVGVSLPLLRDLLAEFGVQWIDLWGAEILAN